MFNINELRLFRMFNNDFERGLRHINTWQKLTKENIVINENNLRESMRQQLKDRRARGLFDAALK